MISYRTARRVLSALAGLFVSVSGVSAETEIEVVSKSAFPAATTGGPSSALELSADGRWALFASAGSFVTPNDRNGSKVDLFLRDLKTGVTTLISTNAAGLSASGNTMWGMISADGEHVVFESDAPDLAPNDENGGVDVFRYSRATGRIEMLSQTASEGKTGEASIAAMSRNGRYVVFESTADDLVSTDTNLVPDLFLVDQVEHTRTLLTKAWDADRTGTFYRLLSISDRPLLGDAQVSISDDGRYVALIASMEDLVPLKSGPFQYRYPQLYLWDRATGTNRLIRWSESDSYWQNRSSSLPILTPDGRYLAFRSVTLNNEALFYRYDLSENTVLTVGLPYWTTRTGVAEAFLSADGNRYSYEFGGQIYLYDILAATNRLISASPDGAPGSTPSGEHFLSDDGKTIIFTSFAGGLTTNTGPKAVSQLYRYDVDSGELTLLSRAYEGSNGADRDISYPTLSADGKVAGFTTLAQNLLPGLEPRHTDVFVTPTSGAGPAELVSVGDSRFVSQTANAGSRVGPNALSLDGHYLVFTSDATDLVPNDTNRTSDIFLRDFWKNETRIIDLTPDGRQRAAPSLLHGISQNGRTVLYSAQEPTELKPTWNLISYVVPTGETRVEASSGPFQEVSLSADGRFASFIQPAPRAIVVRDLLNHSNVFVTAFTSTPIPRISPQGRFLSISYPPAAGSLIDFRSGETKPFEWGTYLRGEPFLLDDESMILTRLSEPMIGAQEDLYLFSLPDLSSNRIAENVIPPIVVSPDRSTVFFQRSFPGSSLSEGILQDIATSNSVSLVFGPKTLGIQEARFSPDGRFLVFATKSWFEGAASSGRNDVFVYDRVLTNLSVLSESIFGGEGNGPSNHPAVAVGGGLVAFNSMASDLVPNDLNSLNDVFVAHLPPVDTNHNGLEDGWESLNFPGGADPAADDDLDGVSNFQEFIAGTDPHDATSVFAFGPVVRTGFGTIQLEWVAATGRSYQIQFRSTLEGSEWENVGPIQTALSRVITLEATIESPSGFYRLQTR